MKQIFKIEELIGKTIKNIHQHFDEFLMSFEDGSFVVLSLENQATGYEYDRYYIVVDEYGKNEADYELVKLGIVTEKEYNLAETLKQEIQEERELEHKKAQEEEIRKYELDQLNKLKEKYGL